MKLPKITFIRDIEVEMPQYLPTLPKQTNCISTL